MASPTECLQQHTHPCLRSQGLGAQAKADFARPLSLNGAAGDLLNTAHKRFPLVATDSRSFSSLDNELLRTRGLVDPQTKFTQETLRGQSVQP
jgi:hypothetical protein